MEGIQRRSKIISYLSSAAQPVSGTELASRFGVSRQVIVQDIALLRATNKNILSTNKGYILYHPEINSTKAKRIFPVFHNSDEIRDELYTIIDSGGKVLDVVVEHDVYGQITLDLILKNRSDVDEFMEKIEHSTSQPLHVLTGGLHYHSVEAENEDILNKIEKQLEEKGFLKK